MSYFTTTPTDTLQHSGKSNTIFTQGESQTTVNEKLAAAIEAAVEKVNKVTEIKDSNDTDLITNKSGFGSQNDFISTDKSAVLKTTATASSVDVFFDLNTALDPNLDTVSYVRVMVETKGGIILDTNKKSTAVSLTPESFPAYISFDLRKTNNKGVTEYLSAKVALPAETKESSVILFKKEFGGTELKTQTEVNNFLYEQVNKISGSIQNKVTIANTDYSINEAFNLLLSKIDNLEKSLSISTAKVIYKNGDGNVTKTVADALTEINDRLNEL